MARILHILDHSLPLQSGYTFRTRAILKAQQAAGHEVQAITGLRHAADGPRTEVIDDLAFHRTRGETINFPFLHELCEIFALEEAICELAKRWQPDILHAHSPALCGMAGQRAAKKLGLPLVYEIRAFWEDAAVGNGTGTQGSLKYKLTRALENRVLRNANAVMTICRGLREDLIERGIPAQKIGVMPNGVDLTLFGKPLERDRRLAAELGIGEGPVLGFIGSFYDYEGIEDLISAMPAILGANPDAHLLLVGGGPMAESLKARAEASPARPAIHFTGRVPHLQVDRYYSLCDVMVYPRKASRLTELVTPLKPLEAMAQGKLVAASNVGGHRELIQHGETGILFPPDDPIGCARAISELLAQPELWEILRDSGKRHVRKDHDWATNVRRYDDVYQVLLNGKTEPSIAMPA